MRVMLKVSRAGPDGAQNAGDEIDVSDDEAKRLFEAGQAEPVRKRTAEKAAKKPAGERAAK